MNKNQAPYVAFIIAVLYSAAGMAITISIYISMMQTPGGTGLQLLRLCLPLTAFLIFFFDLRFKYRKVLAHQQTKGRSHPKTPYFIFGFAVLYNIFAMIVAITIYFFMRESAATLAMEIFMLALPITTSIVVFFDMRFKIREIKDYRQSERM